MKLEKLSLLTVALMVLATPFAHADFDGRKTVTSAGTAVILGYGRFDELTICAESDNTGVITIGESPIASLSTREGVFLNASDCWSTERSGDMAFIKLDTTVSGDGVNYYGRNK